MTLSIPTHVMEISQRPRQGALKLGSFPVNNYRHRITAKGGFDSASCSLDVRPAEAEDIFSNYVGCVVAFYVDNPFAPIWEGYIERITYRVGGAVLTRSLENMANRVNVTYYNADSGAAIKTENIQTALGTVIENAASQAIYGLKVTNLDAGIHFNNADKSHKNLLRQTTLAQRAWPQISTVFGVEASGPLIELEMRGLHYMAWDWQTYENVRGSGLDTLTNASRAFQIVTSESGAAAWGGGALVPANASYIYAIGTSVNPNVLAQQYVTGNVSFNIQLASQSAQTYLQYIQGVAEAGDGAKQYVYGIHPPDPTTGIRYTYYSPANAAVAYQVTALRDPGRVRGTDGIITPGWLVRPNNGIQIMDILVGYNQAGDDPRIGYIESIEYDGETGLVSFQTGDNITMEGVLQKDRYYKAHGTKDRFGAQPRNVL